RRRRLRHDRWRPIERGPLALGSRARQRDRGVRHRQRRSTVTRATRPGHAVTVPPPDGCTFPRMGASVSEATAPRGSAGRILLALAAGAAVALSLGIYGTVHDPTGRSLISLFFTATIHLKVWFATAAIALATFQLLTALRMYGKLGRRRGPRWIPRAHRLSGVAAFWL